MIVRIWRGWTRTDDADAYREYMAQVALPGYTDVPGNLAVYLVCCREPVRIDVTAGTKASTDTFTAARG